MKVNETLKKQIIIEIFALLFLITVIGYAIFALNKGPTSKVSSVQGFVTVLDDSRFNGLKSLSDGEGLEQEGLTLTVTNNNNEKTLYNIVAYPNTDNKELLDRIRISVDDLYIYDLTELEQKDDGYVILTHELGAGYTKIHLIKYWYKLNTNENENAVKLNFILVR